MAKDFDEILETVGSYGYYQKWLVYVLLIPATFFSAFTMNLMLFQVVVPDHWCYVPGRENTTLSPEEWRALTLPRAIESEKYSSCLMYKGEWSEDDGANYTVTNETQECISGWQHDPSQFTKTLSTELEWVCEREIYSQHVLSFTMAGNTVGTFLLPILADRYLGRHSVFFLTLAIHIVFTLSYCWVSNIGLHLTLRFFQGLSFESNYLMPYTIVLEVVPPDHRALVIMLLFISWTFGMCFTALVAWLIPNWQYLALITCLPSLLGFSFWRYLPESPRWLLSKGRLGQCVDILLQMARENGKEETSRTHLETGRLIEGLWKGPFGS
ncbi:carcinine transporter-like [Homarus americanus]|uniref:carcinine transporter-like n=1 Tax=Homarus americanus TaxID=6706 RepID=UPI001C439FD1|nr:carcinine transporter-like [Homarus americanus]